MRTEIMFVLTEICFLPFLPLPSVRGVVRCAGFGGAA
ncbi:hypothetical protein PSEUDO8AS_70193 [Pseudomonas sp. 8AS]|nr:hypothetical protein PSEUDO8AS_70193 [Pseudomonas sp. 8AS]